MGGSYSGTAVPHVNGPAPRSYQQPQNWASPAVSGRDLIVHRDVLRQVASDLAQMADELQATLGAAGAQAAPAASAAGGWPEARQFAGGDDPGAHRRHRVHRPAPPGALRHGPSG